MSNFKINHSLANLCCNINLKLKEIKSQNWMYDLKEKGIELICLRTSKVDKIKIWVNDF